MDNCSIAICVTLQSLESVVLQLSDKVISEVVQHVMGERVVVAIAVPLEVGRTQVRRLNALDEEVDRPQVVLLDSIVQVIHNLTTPCDGLCAGINHGVDIDHARQVIYGSRTLLHILNVFKLIELVDKSGEIVHHSLVLLVRFS